MEGGVRMESAGGSTCGKGGGGGGGGGGGEVRRELAAPVSMLPVEMVPLVPLPSHAAVPGECMRLRCETAGKNAGTADPCMEGESSAVARVAADAIEAFNESRQEDGVEYMCVVILTLHLHTRNARSKASPPKYAYIHALLDSMASTMRRYRKACADCGNVYTSHCITRLTGTCSPCMHACVCMYVCLRYIPARSYA